MIDGRTFVNILLEQAPTHVLHLFWKTTRRNSSLQPQFKLQNTTPIVLPRLLERAEIWKRMRENIIIPVSTLSSEQNGP